MRSARGISERASRTPDGPVSVRFAEDELSCLHEGRDLVAREVVVGSTHVRIRFEPDSRIVRKH